MSLFSVLVSDKKSERAKDMHLLRRLTTLLRAREVEPGQIYLIIIHERPYIYIRTFSSCLFFLRTITQCCVLVLLHCVHMFEFTFDL